MFSILQNSTKSTFDWKKKAENVDVAVEYLMK